MAIVYDVYCGDGNGSPPTVLVATVTGTTFTLPQAPGTAVRYAVRARDTVTGYDDGNGDAQALVTLDATGGDATYAPGPVRTLAAFATAGGGAVAEWSYPCADRSRVPTEFRVYLAVPPAAADFAARPAAVVPCGGANALRFHYRVLLAGLRDGVAYAVTVRAANAAGDDGSTAAATLTASSAPPAPVAGLAAAGTY